MRGAGGVARRCGARGRRSMRAERRSRRLGADRPGRRGLAARDGEAAGDGAEAAAWGWRGGREASVGEGGGDVGGRRVARGSVEVA